MSAEFKRRVNKQLKGMFEKDIDKIIMIGLSQNEVVTSITGFDTTNDILGVIELSKYKIIEARTTKDKP